MSLDRLSWLPVTSHGPLEGLHTVLAVANISEGQEAELPVQSSSLSQILTEVRHTVELDASISDGQPAELPVHFSIQVIFN
jgi:hypothetical protein